MTVGLLNYNIEPVLQCYAVHKELYAAPGFEMVVFGQDFGLQTSRQDLVGIHTRVVCTFDTTHENNQHTTHEKLNESAKIKQDFDNSY